MTMKTKTRFVLTAHPEIGEGDTEMYEIVAPNPAVAHDTAKAAYATDTGVPIGLVHTKIVERKEVLSK